MMVSKAEALILTVVSILLVVGLFVGGTLAFHSCYGEDMLVKMPSLEAPSVGAQPPSAPPTTPPQYCVFMAPATIHSTVTYRPKKKPLSLHFQQELRLLNPTDHPVLMTATCTVSLGTPRRVIGAGVIKEKLASRDSQANYISIQWDRVVLTKRKAALYFDCSCSAERLRPPIGRGVLQSDVVPLRHLGDL